MTELLAADQVHYHMRGRSVIARIKMKVNSEGLLMFDDREDLTVSPFYEKIVSLELPPISLPTRECAVIRAVLDPSFFAELQIDVQEEMVLQRLSPGMWRTTGEWRLVGDEKIVEVREVLFGGVE